MLKRCVIYLRVSTAEQAAPGHHSLDAQQILCSRYAEGAGFQVVEILRDEGYSGRTINRPGMRRLIEYTSAHPPTPIQAILIQDTSRMGRDTTEYLLFRRQLRERGIELVAVTQPNIDSSPEGTLVDTILAGINQYQSEEKGRRVCIAMTKKFEEGWWPNKAPLGYLNVVRDGRHFVEPDPKTFDLVRLAFTLYASGRYSQIALAKFLQERGLTGREGTIMSRTSMNKLLSNPFYWGLLRWSGQERPGLHEPAVDRIVWERCQAVTAQHNQYAVRVRKHKFLLSGLLVCDDCRSHLSHTVVARKGNRYYHCPSRSYCKQPYFPDEKIEGKVAELIGSIELTEDFITRVVDKVRVLLDRTNAFQNAQRSTLLRHRTLTESKRNVLEQKLLKRLFSDEAFARNYQIINDELDTVDRQLTDLEASRRVDVDKLREILLFARDLPKAYAQASPALKRQYVHFFFKRFVVKKGEIIRTERTEMFTSLLQENRVRTKNRLLRDLDSNQDYEIQSLASCH